VLRLAGSGTLSTIQLSRFTSLYRGVVDVAWYTGGVHEP
jgi:hypothetical protein